MRADLDPSTPPLRQASFQDRMRDNFCWGCGSDNHAGLQLKCSWDGDASVATWTPRPEHSAGPRHVLNGGVIATLLDCQGCSTAIADRYRREGRAVGSDPEIWYVTASLEVEYLRPTPLDQPLSIRGEIVERDERRTIVACTLTSGGKDRARARVETVRVPPDWKQA